MPQYVIDRKDFVKGLALSEELGGFFANMQGVTLYSRGEIGILQPANKEVASYTETSSTGLTSPITRLLYVSNNSTQYVLGLSSDYGIGIRLTDGGTPLKEGEDATNPGVVTFTEALNIGDKKGAALYHLGSQSSYDIGVFYSLDNNIGCYDVTKTFTSETQWKGTFMTTTPANDGSATIASATFRAMYHHKRHDILYWNTASGSTGNTIDKFDANVGVNGTLYEQVLDLPKGWEVRDFGQLRDYLAILAITPPGGTADDDFVQAKSKVFFWDGVSDSWQYETPTINDHLIRLIDTEDGLFALGKGDGVSYYRIDLELAERLHNWSGNGAAIDITAGRRDGNDIAKYGAVTTVGREVFFLGKDGTNAHVFSIGDRFGISTQRALKKIFYLQSATGIGTLRLGDIVAARPDKFYASYWNDVDGSGTVTAGDKYRIVRFSRFNAPTKDGRVDTVELDSYFGGTGRLKKLTNIRIDTDKLLSGQVLEVYKEIDYDGAWTRIDGGGSAGATNAIRFADLASETTTGFSAGDIFRHLRLRLDFTGGDVKIRRIVVEFEYAE